MSLFFEGKIHPLFFYIFNLVFQGKIHFINNLSIVLVPFILSLIFQIQYLKNFQNYFGLYAMESYGAILDLNFNEYFWIIQILGLFLLILHIQILLLHLFLLPLIVLIPYWIFCGNFKDCKSHHFEFFTITFFIFFISKIHYFLIIIAFIILTLKFLSRIN